MLSATFWVMLFIVFVALAMGLRGRLRGNRNLRDWYERTLRDRLDLLKKIIFYGTLILWVGIWLATRGDEKSSLGALLGEISNSWRSQEKSRPLPETAPGSDNSSDPAPQ